MKLLTPLALWRFVHWMNSYYRMYISQIKAVNNNYGEYLILTSPTRSVSTHCIDLFYTADYEKGERCS